MKKVVVFTLSLVMALCLAACGQKLPPVADQAQLEQDFPAELSAVTVEKETQKCQLTSLEVTARETDLTRQTDNVSCKVELTGTGFILRYDCTLNYTYTQNGGWQVEDYRLDTVPVIELTTEQCFQGQTIANTASLKESGYTIVGLTEETYDCDTQSYSQTFQVARADGYLLTQGTTRFSGGLIQVDNFSYRWESHPVEESLEQTTQLDGTVWHLLEDAEEGRVEMAFRLDEDESGALTVSGLVRFEDEDKDNWVSGCELTGGVLSWQGDEYGGIRFTFTDQDGGEWEACFTGEENFLSREGLYLGHLSSAELPQNGELEDLMELKISTPPTTGGSFTDWLSNIFGFWRW